MTFKILSLNDDIVLGNQILQSCYESARTLVQRYKIAESMVDRVRMGEVQIKTPSVLESYLNKVAKDLLTLHVQEKVNLALEGRSLKGRFSNEWKQAIEDQYRLFMEDEFCENVVRELRAKLI